MGGRRNNRNRPADAHTYASMMEQLHHEWKGSHPERAPKPEPVEQTGSVRRYCKACDTKADMVVTAVHEEFFYVRCPCGNAFSIRTNRPSPKAT